MSIWDTILGRPPQALKLQDTTVRHMIPKVPVLDYTAASLSVYATKSELVYACIEKKAQTACDPELIIQEKKGDDWETVDSHPALEMLKEPNQWDDGESFLRTWIASENIAGEFYAEIVLSQAGVPAALYPLRPDYIFPQYRMTAKGDVLEYYAYRINGYEVKFKPEDLLIRRRHGLGSMYSGVSPLYVALGSVDADISATEYIRAFYNNGGSPSGILTISDRKLSQEEMEAIQQKWIQRYGRGGKARGGPAVLDSAAEYQPIGSNLDELNSESLTSIDETRICMAFGVPPVLIGAYVGLKNVNQKASFKGAMEEFWMNTMSPELKQIRKFLTRKLLPLFGEGERVMKNEIRFFWDMSAVEALQDDVDAIHDRISLGYKTGIYMLDEAREGVGLDPVGGEEGEAFYTAPADPNADVLGAETLVEKRERLQDFKLDEIATNGQKKTFEFNGLTLSREPTELEKPILKAIADSYDSGKDALTRIILDIKRDLVNQAVDSIKKRSDSDVFTLTLTPPKNAYKQVAKIIMLAVQMGGDQISEDADRAKNWKGGGWLTKSIVDDLIRRLVELTVSRIINEVQTAAINIFTALGVLGLDADEIEQRMREELDDRSDKPFEAYARQAINEAVNAGRREEMDARSDEIEKYVYSAILDQNTCSPCEGWDGEEASSQDQLPETPNEECEGMSNCRCFIIAVFAGEVS